MRRGSLDWCRAKADEYDARAARDWDAIARLARDLRVEAEGQKRQEVAAEQITWLQKRLSHATANQRVAAEFRAAAEGGTA